jgi:hypothetical protein
MENILADYFLLIIYIMKKRLGVAAYSDYEKRLANMTDEDKQRMIKSNNKLFELSPEEAPSPKPPTESQKHQKKTAKRIRSDKSRSPRPSRGGGGFSYYNAGISQNGGRKTIRKVSIKNGKGHKSITQYKKNKKMFSVKKPLSMIEIVTIQRGQFIPGLFSDCKGPGCMKNKTRKTY